ncbi:MAG: hypothetical protein ACI9OH_001427 [Oleispira sp.]|jgi:hypothetical protein
MKGIFIPALLSIVLMLSGCELTDTEKEKLDNAAEDLQQLADQIIITNPAKNSTVESSWVTVRADIPSSVNASEVKLLVDGIEIAKDSNGAPWEIQWPAYYFADGNLHTLLLKTVTEDGIEIRNNEQFQLTVSTEANAALSFSQGTDGIEIQDTDSHIVGFSAFEGATHYEVSYDEKSIVTTTTTLELTDLGVGAHKIKYRALTDQITNSPFSNEITLSVIPPSPPLLNEADVKIIDDSYQVTLSWQPDVANNQYEIFWGPQDNPVSIGTTDETSYQIPNIELGYYSYFLQKTNSLGQKSDFSLQLPVEVGVFRTQLGGSQHDRAHQIIPSNQGGYLVRASTASYEVSSTLNGTDDWIIRLDSNGKVVKEAVFNALGRDRFSDILESSDGTIYLAGNNWNTKEALLLKLNSNLEKEWEISYKPSGVTERYDFKKLVIWNEKLYVSAIQWKTSGGSSRYDSPYLHEVDIENGAISNHIALPSIPGIKLDNFKSLFVDSSNNLVLAGIAAPEIPNESISGMDSSGAFILRINAEIETVNSWNNVGGFKHINVGSAIELSNGHIAIVGQSVMGGEPAISIIDTSGREHRSYQGSDNFYGSSNLSANTINGFYGLFKDSGQYSYPYPMQLIEFNANAIPITTKYLLKEGGYLSGVGIIKNNDTSLTILFDAGQNEYNNYDVVIKRIPAE